MGLLDSVINAAAGTLLKDNSDLQQKLSGLISEFFTSVGGLPGLISKFQSNGLGDIISSWLSSGENLSVSSDQLHQVVGSDLIKDLASKAGIDASLFDTLLANGLPKLVSTLTANGKVSPEQITNIDLEKAKDLVSQIFS